MEEFPQIQRCKLSAWQGRVMTVEEGWSQATTGADDEQRLHVDTIATNDVRRPYLVIIVHTSVILPFLFIQKVLFLSKSVDLNVNNSKVMSCFLMRGGGWLA